MSYNKAQFQVAFKPSDLIDNLKSAQIAALGRDRTIAQLNKMSNLDNPWAKLTAYSALGRFAQQYQHEQIEALGGAGSGDLQKQYMRDVSSYLEQKTSHAKKEQDIQERIREADVYGVMSYAAGMENIEGEYEGGAGGGLYGVEGSGSEAEEAAERGSALAAAQARSEFGLELEAGRARFSSLVSELRGSITSEAQQGSLSAPPEQAVEGRRRKKLGGGRERLREPQEALAEFREREALMIEQGMIVPEGRRKKLGAERKSRGERIESGGGDPRFMSEFEQEERELMSMRLGRQPSPEEFSRRKKLGRRGRRGLASFEEAFEEQGGSFSYFDEPSSGGGAAFDPSAIAYEFIGQNPPPAKATQSQLEAWEEFLIRLVARGGNPITFKKFKEEFYRSEF